MAERSRVVSSSGSTSSSNLLHVGVDDFYFALLLVLEEDEELFPVTDEKYAEQLWFQEALMSSLHCNPNNHTHRQKVPEIIGGSSSENEGNNNSSTNTSSNKKKRKAVDMNHDSAEAAGKFSLSFCGICMEGKPRTAMFKMSNSNKCPHTFCSECMSKHIAAKIQENIMMVKCPELNCREMIEPHMCRAIIPEQVFDRWENALCESLILGSQKIYCPFKNCSAMLEDDGEEVIRETECPHCRRLFCAQCKVPWHSEMRCHDFQRLNKDERGREDLMLIGLAKKKRWRRCSNCKVYVEKTDGCLHITCRCGFQFCYRCGGRWNQRHHRCLNVRDDQA